MRRNSMSYQQAEARMASRSSDRQSQNCHQIATSIVPPSKAPLSSTALCGQRSPPHCVLHLLTAALALKCAVRRYQIFKGLLGAFDEERRRFRGRLREQELLMQVRYPPKAQRRKRHFALQRLCLSEIGSTLFI